MRRNRKRNRRHIALGIDVVGFGSNNLPYKTRWDQGGREQSTVVVLFARGS